MREVFTELEKICSSPEDSLVKIESGDEEEEGMEMIEISNSWTIAVTAPAPAPRTSNIQTMVIRSYEIMNQTKAND
ncbi:hypothetical protein YC2023_058187 [Brassica napus]